MAKRRSFVDSVIAAVGKVLPTAQVTISSKVEGYKGKQKVKIGNTDGHLIKLVIHDKDEGKKEAFVRASEPLRALAVIHEVFAEQQIPIAA